jgi:[ribosomal protein S5]-alanine N-acetyltransferase
MGRLKAEALADAGTGLGSPRLLLRRFTPADLPLLTALNADPQVMRYLGGVMSPQQTRSMLESRILAYYEANPGLGVWATLLRDSGDCIGFHLLNHIQGESLIQVGYRLFPRYWGQGYATEMSKALLRYGYTQLELPSIVAITALENLSSQHALLKAGLRRNGERSFPHPAYAAYGPHAWFEGAAEAWLAEHPTIEP